MTNTRKAGKEEGEASNNTWRKKKQPGWTGEAEASKKRTSDAKSVETKTHGKRCIGAAKNSAPER